MYRYLKQAFVLALVLLALDQFTKQWVVDHYGLFQGFEVTSFLNIIRVHNPGAAFSFLAQAGGWQRHVFTGLAFAVSAYLIWQMWHSRGVKLAVFSMALIVCGAIGNAIDRLRFGYVVDFIDVHAYGMHWPAFNVADSCICIGAALLIWHEIKLSRQPK